jgi:VWFA-related protein
MKDRWLAAPYHLSQLAHDTGGRPIAVRNLESLTSIYEEIAAELRHLYRLGYVPAQAARDGRWHAISVRVRRPDARVRTRTGYYAPRPSSVVAKGRIR